MSGAVLRRAMLVVVLGVAGLAHAADPQQLLTRMQKAAGDLNYDGIFVYQHGDQLETLRIIHKKVNGVMRERLVSLNGAPREILRTGDEVRCYLPDENAVMIEHRRADSRNFPALLPDSLAVLKKNYRIQSGGRGRVAGRTALAAQIKPRDAYRYGYVLWADKSTGLLLKASLIDESGNVIEQYMFTQISIDRPIPDSDLAPQHSARNVVARRAGDEQPPVSTRRWEAAKLPPGYTLSAHMQRKLPARRQPVEHLVYSDGLAVVSVFVEPVGDATQGALSGLTHMGAVHAYGKVEDGHQITVLGETPAMTVDMIGASVASRP